MLLEHYNNLVEVTPELPALESVLLDCKATGFDNAVTTLAAIELAKPLSGWLLCASKLIEMRNGWIAPSEQDGMPLHGEWALNEHQSLSLRHLGLGKFALTRISEGSGPQAFAERIYFLHRNKQGVIYRRFLRDMHDGHGTRAFAFRFAGFSRKGERR